MMAMHVDPLGGKLKLPWPDKTTKYKTYGGCSFEPKKKKHIQLDLSERSPLRIVSFSDLIKEKSAASRQEVVARKAASLPFVVALSVDKKGVLRPYSGDYLNQYCKMVDTEK